MEQSNEEMVPPQGNSSSATGSSNTCDESKCVSRGRSQFHKGVFTCYGNDAVPFFPMMCADGFLPKVIENEPPRMALAPDGSKEFPVQYFTCCPPDEEEEEPQQLLSFDATTRHCSDPLLVPRNSTAEMNDALCQNIQDTSPTQQYAHKLKPDNMALLRGTNGILCCDQELDDEIITNNFLAENAECVPYRNQSYDVAIAQNTVGQLSPVTCDLPGFEVPIARSPEEFQSTGRYQCCKTGSEPLPPFVQDQAYDVSVYPNVVLWSLSVAVSLIVAVALLVPLVNGSYKQQSRAGSVRDSGKSWKVSRRGSKEKVGNSKSQYSIYNLYLIYLSTYDFFFSLARLVVFGGMANQVYFESYYAAVVVPTNPTLTNMNALVLCAYVFANTSINAVVCYQVYVLLRSLENNSHRRLKQPSLRTVNLQAGSICGISLLVGYGMYLLLTFMRRAQVAGDITTAKRYYNFYNLSQGILFGGPFLYVLVVSILIWWKGYLKPNKDNRQQPVTSLEKAMRELAVYFFRIISVFVAVWLPSLCLTAYGVKTVDSKGWVFVLTGILTALQPLLTFCVVLTKSDVRGYILDLITLSFLFGGKDDGKKDFSNKNTTLVGKSISPSAMSFARSSIGLSAMSFAVESDDDDDDLEGDLEDDASIDLEIATKECHPDGKETIEDVTEGDNEEVVRANNSKQDVDSGTDNPSRTNDDIKDELHSSDRSRNSQEVWIKNCKGEDDIDSGAMNTNSQGA